MHSGFSVSTRPNLAKLSCEMKSPREKVEGAFEDLIEEVLGHVEYPLVGVDEEVCKGGLVVQQELLHGL